MKRKIIHCLFFGGVTLLLLLTCLPARAETFCERNWARYQDGGLWDRRCGPTPGLPFKAEMARDCAITRSQIRSREGASWNSEFGWAAEDQCEALEQEGRV